MLLAVLSHQIVVFTHEPLIFISLVWIKFIESHFHLLMDAGEFVLECFSFLFDFLSLQEDLIEFGLELIILILDMLVSHFNILGPGVYSKFIQGKVIIGQLSL